MDFSGKVVAITGAAGGIGQALCRHFVGLGAKVGAIDRSEAVKDFARDLAREARGINPGTGRIRLALVATVDECTEAAQRLKRFAASL